MCKSDFVRLHSTLIDPFSILSKMIAIFVILSALSAFVLAQDNLPSTKVSTCGWFFGTSGGQDIRFVPRNISLFSFLSFAYRNLFLSFLHIEID
jgi:hypothetical protein